MAPKIGQRATLNGHSVRWSGDHYGWQSQGSYDQLKNNGQLRIGSAFVRSAQQAFNNVAGSIPGAQRYLQGVAAEGQRQQQVKDQVLQRAGFNTAGPNATQRAIEGVSRATNVNSALVQGAAVLAQAAVEGKAGANTLRILPQAHQVQRGKNLAAAANSADNGVQLYGGVPMPMGRRPSPGGGATKTPAQVRAASAPGKSPTHAFADAQKTPNVATDNWVAVGRQRPDGTVVDTGSFAQLSPENKALARQGQLPGSPPEFRGRVYIEQAQNSAVPPVKGRNASDFIPDDAVRRNSANGPVTQYGEPTAAPYSTNQSLQIGPGNPRPQRVHVEGQPGPKRLAQGFDVRTSDMAPPRGDGNRYGPFERVSELPDGWQKSGNFIVNNDQAYRINRDKMRKTFLEGKATAKDFSAVREAAAWADGDIDKLNNILVGLGGKPQQYPSNALRAIERKLGALENKYGGKPSLSKAERQQYTDQWDWENLNGNDRREAQRLSELATQRFGEGQPGRQPITQQPSGGFKGGQTVPPTSQQPRSRGGRLPSRSVRPASATPPQARTERADRLQIKRDEKLYRQQSKPQYQPKLSDAERDAARRRRASRPLRPASQRTAPRKAQPSKKKSFLQRLFNQ